MTERLREELARVGDTAPRAVVPADVWARGRRARRRDRLAAGGAVLSVLLVLGGLGVVLGTSGRSDVAPVSPGQGGAVPSVIHGVPERLGGYGGGGEDASWKPSVAETSLAIGRASLAFASGDYEPLPVVITAADGDYHLLNLPGWVGSNIGAGVVEGSPLALSPDGRELAYGWYDRATFGTDKEDVVTAGVRIIDLETGKVRTVRLKGGHGVAAGRLQWSEDSRWLVWQGQALGHWSEGQAGGGHPVAGRVAPGASASTPIAISRAAGLRLAIDDHGTVGWVEDGGYHYATTGKLAGSITDVLGDRAVTAGRFGPEGELAFASTEPSAGATFFVADDTHPVLRGSVSLRPVTRALPEGHFPEGASVEPLGWLDDSTVLEQLTPAHGVTDGGWTSDAPQIAVMSTDGTSFEVVTRVDADLEHDGRVQGLSVAVDLLDPLKTTTRDFPAPEWPWSDEKLWAVWGGLGVGVLAAVVFGLAYRRGRRLA